MRNTISFLLDGGPVEIDFSRENSIRPTTTVLNYLRSLPSHRGAKEGCAEGDCGACTVVIAGPSGDGGLTYRAVDSCLLFLPMIDGKQLITIENLRSPDGALHPVQEAIVAHHGSQCGFCTPGFIMSMFALYKSPPARHARRSRMDSRGISAAARGTARSSMRRWMPARAARTITFTGGEGAFSPASGRSPAGP